MTLITEEGSTIEPDVGSASAVILTFPQTRPFHAAGSFIATPPDSAAEVVVTEKCKEFFAEAVPLFEPGDTSSKAT